MTRSWGGGARHPSISTPGPPVGELRHTHIRSDVYIYPEALNISISGQFMKQPARGDVRLPPPPKDSPSSPPLRFRCSPGSACRI